MKKHKQLPLDSLIQNGYDLPYLRDIQPLYTDFKKVSLANQISIVDQGKSGRCWIFSFLDLLRYSFIPRYDLANDFEFSQSYLYFYDKLEKSYYFLNLIIENRHLDDNSRLNEWLFKNVSNDGGNWNMLVNLIQKYGIVPKSDYKDSFQAKHSYRLNKQLQYILRGAAGEIRFNRDWTNKKCTRFIKKTINDIYQLLCIYLSEPPKTICFKGKEMAPLEFKSRYVKFKPNDWFIAANFPLKETPYFQRYKILYCNNMVGGRPTNLVNLPFNILTKLAKSSIDQGIPIWAAVDWSQNYDCERSELRINTRKTILPQSVNPHQWNKNRIIRSHLSKPNHAVLIVGYAENKEGIIEYWEIKNSHGVRKCKYPDGSTYTRKGKGYVKMSQDWFQKYCYYLSFQKKDLPFDIQYFPKIELQPWDLMGCELL